MEDAEQLQGLLEKIYRQRGLDFRLYRQSTLSRRLARRLRARGVKTYSEYARVLDETPGEYDKLFDDLTINVTSFFRDEAAFEALEKVVLPELIHRNRETGRSLRIWSAACATGQESYSIAMLLSEAWGKEAGRNQVTILATDIDAQALEQARKGIFTPKDMEDIHPAWRERYFVPEGDCFRVRPALRSLVTFERRNLVSDPPYRRLDMVLCRNVLIYFTPALQMRVLRGFHAGLRKEGYLLIGKAEVPAGDTKKMFHCLDNRAKLYQKT